MLPYSQLDGSLSLFTVVCKKSTENISQPPLIVFVERSYCCKPTHSGFYTRFISYDLFFKCSRLWLCSSFTLEGIEFF